MTSINLRRRWGMIIVMIVTVMSMFVSAGAEGIDLTDNAAAVEYLAGTGAFNAEAEDAQDYKTAASTFIDNYSENVV